MKSRSVALELNFSKVYDWYEREYLEQAAVRMCFSTDWMKLVMVCVITPTYSFSSMGLLMVGLLQSMVLGRVVRFPLIYSFSMLRPFLLCYPLLRLRDTFEGLDFHTIKWFCTCYLQMVDSFFVGQYYVSGYSNRTQK